MFAVQYLSARLIRPLKCDETHPSCTKCNLYGVTCDYAGSKPSLNIAAQGSFQVDLTSSVPRQHTISFDTGIRSRAHVIDSFFEPVLGSEDLITITKPFTTTTNNTLGTPWSPLSINAAITATMNHALRLGSSSLDLHSVTGSSSSSFTSSWEFSEAHLDILARFQTRTALTIGGKCLPMMYVYKATCD
jgi:hypothetical protein